MHPFFENLVECMTEDLFLQEFSRKYHYEEEQMALLREVSFAMQKNICTDNQTGKAGWKNQEILEVIHNAEDGQESGAGSLTGCPVCITLGPGVDALQETYLTTGRLTEAYMVETLGSELLLKAYPQWNGRIAVQGRYRVKRYHFLGSEEQYPIETLPTLLETLNVPVTCTSAFCMLPKKSVAFYAELVAQAARGAETQAAQGTEPQDADDRAAGPPAERDEHFCEGICAGCNSTNCPNRMEKHHGSAWDTDMTDRPFTYGYQRIFGIR